MPDTTPHVRNTGGVRDVPVPKLTVEIRRNRMQFGSGEDILYHYTTFFGVAGIATAKSIWCSQIQYMNDIGELRHGLGILRDVCSRDFGNHVVASQIAERSELYKDVNVFVSSSPRVATSSVNGAVIPEFLGYLLDSLRISSLQKQKNLVLY